MSNELPNDLGLTILRNQEILQNSQNFTIIAQCSVAHPKSKFCQYQQKSPEKQKLMLFPQCAISHENQSLCQIFCLRKQFLTSNSPQQPSNLICMTILITYFPIFSQRPKFGIEAFQVWSRTFFQKDKVNSSQKRQFLAIAAVYEDIKSKRNFWGHSGSQYFGTFGCLIKFCFPHK